MTTGDFPQAAAGSLRQVLDEERLRMVRAGAKVRIIIVLFCLCIVLIPNPGTPIVPSSRVSIIVWVVLALLVYRAARRATYPSAIILIGPALADVLVVGFAAVYGIRVLQTIPHAAGFIEPNDLATAGMAYLCGLIVTSALTMSFPAIAVSASAAGLFMLALLVLTMPLSPVYGLAIMAPVGIALALRELIKRINILVSESRKKDLMGKYVLGERIGSGGMAEVFEALYCPEGGFVRKVAVKKILPSHANTPEFVRLFRREAELGAMLVHPNLVQVLDFGADASTYFLAMEYVDGVTLSQILVAAHSSQSKLTQSAWAYLAWCLADALSFIHDVSKPGSLPLRLVHRDVNPPNILVSVAGDVKLTDFGIAREVSGSNLTAAGSIRGKLSYAAPEQLQGAAFDHRVDLFALGVTLWEAWVGERYYPSGAADVEIIRRGLMEPPIRPSSRRQDTPVEIDALIMPLLAKDPNERTDSGRHLMQQLMTLPAALTDGRTGRSELSILAKRTKTDKSLDSYLLDGVERAAASSPDEATSTLTIRM